MTYDPAYDFAFSLLHGVSPYMHYEIPEFEPRPVLFEERLHGYFYALVDSCTPPEPRDITEASQVGAWMLSCGAPDTGRDIGRSVQRWRDAARDEGHARLRAILLDIETMVDA